MTQRVKQIIEALAGAVIALLSFGLYERAKKQSAEALITNVETKDKLNKLDAKVLKDETLEDLEASKRKQIEDNVKKVQDENLNKKDLVDFFNNNK